MPFFLFSYQEHRVSLVDVGQMPFPLCGRFGTYILAVERDVGSNADVSVWIAGIREEFYHLFCPVRCFNENLGLALARRRNKRKTNNKR